MTVNIAAGPSADYCPTFPNVFHAMSSCKPAHTSIFVRRCDWCGWIDGEDLERQVASHRQQSGTERITAVRRVIATHPRTIGLAALLAAAGVVSLLVARKRRA